MLSHERLPEIQRILNYLRRSRKDEELERRTGEDTLALHEKIMDDVLTPLGVPYDTIKEVASGETIEGRPEFVKILRWLEEGRYQAISVKEISRLGRGDMKDMGTVLEVIKDKEVLIITPERIYDIANSNEDYDFVSFQLIISNFELRFIVRRLVLARKERAREGRWMSTVPYGYDRDKASKRLLVNEDEAKIVELIFRWYAFNNMGDRVIANRLSNMKVPCPRNGGVKKKSSETDWDETTVGRILKNNVYIGTSRFGMTKWKSRQKKVIPQSKDLHIYHENAHPAIIDQETFEMAQKLRKKKQDLGYPKNQYDNPNYEPYELTSLLTCSECGLTIRAAKSIKKYKNGETVEIRSLRCKKGCNYIAYETVLGYVEQLLKMFKSIDVKELQSYLAQSQIINEIKEIETKKSNKISEQNFNERITALKSELVSAARYIGTMGEDVFLQVKNRIESEISAIEEIKKSHEEASISVQDDKERTSTVISLAELYESCQTRAQKQRILKSIFHHIELKVLERGTKAHPAKCQLTPYFKYHIKEIEQ